mgnify:CR=1 FL=1
MKKTLLIGLSSIAILLLGLYVGMTIYFNGHYFPNTYIGTIPSAGKTPEDVISKKKLLKLVEKKKWVSEEQLLDCYAVGQCTPGIIAVNTATFIGQKNKGVAGGIFATLGVVFPSLIIISILAGAIEAFSHLTIVQNALGGIRICVCVLIFNSVVKLYQKAVMDKATLVIFLVVALGSFFAGISPVIFVIGTAAAGILLKKGGKQA